MDPLPTSGVRYGGQREGDCFFILGRHRRRVLPGQSKGEVVEAIPKVLESVPDDEGEFVREWLQLLCAEFEAPLAVGLLKDSIAIERPDSERCFDFLDMEFCSGELVAMAE